MIYHICHLSLSFICGEEGRRPEQDEYDYHHFNKVYIVVKFIDYSE